MNVREYIDTPYWNLVIWGACITLGVAAFVVYAGQTAGLEKAGFLVACGGIGQLLTNTIACAKLTSMFKGRARINLSCGALLLMVFVLAAALLTHGDLTVYADSVVEGQFVAFGGAIFGVPSVILGLYKSRDTE